MKKWDPTDPLDDFVEWAEIDFCSAIRPQDMSLYHNSRITYTKDFLANKDLDPVEYLMADEKGYSYVVQCLANNFVNRIRKNSRITRIQTANDCVCVTVEEGSLYCGNSSIVTFSIGVLQASIRGDESSVRFDPPLPQEKQAALRSVTPVHYGKIHLQFDTQFWDELSEDRCDTQLWNITEGQRILGYVADRGYYPYFIFDKNRPNTITADITEDLAMRVATQSEEDTVREVMDVLRTMFINTPIPEPHTAIISKWSTDPLFLCTFSVLSPGVSENIFKDLLEPVNGRLYFAGEAVNGSNSGFTQGGYGSGVCVANLLMGKMREYS